MSRLTEKCSGKYLKKLIGKTDVEDALKRLEKLTNEEVRMATAQILKATHTVDDRVRVVDNKVLDVDNKVADVDDRVAGVDDRVARVDERVAGVDDCVKTIDDKVTVVIDGAQPSLIRQQQKILNSDIPRGKRNKVGHTTSRRRHGSSQKLVIFFLHRGVQAKAFLQGINYDTTFADGSLRRIPLLTTTLLVVPIASKQRTGFSKEVSSPNGNPKGHFCGSTENVRPSDLSSRWPLITTSCSGLWEERTLVCPYQTLSTLSYSPPG